MHVPAVVDEHVDYNLCTDERSKGVISSGFRNFGYFDIACVCVCECNLLRSYLKTNLKERLSLSRSVQNQ